MSDDCALILGAASNIGVVQMPGRNYPGVVIQGDPLYSMLFRALDIAQELKKLSYGEDIYIQIPDLVSELRNRLIFYEATLEQHGFNKPRVPMQDRYVELLQDVEGE